MSKVNQILNDLATEQAQSLDYIVGMGSVLAVESREVAFLDTAKSKFYDFVSHLQGFFNSLKIGNYKGTNLDPTPLVTKLNEQGWDKNRDLHCTIAPGFSGQWTEFLDLLINKILPAAEGANDSLKVTAIRLASVMNEPDRLKAQSGIRDLESKLVLVSKQDFEKVQSYFKANSQSQATLGDIANRNADLKEAYGQLNILNRRLGAIDLTTLDGQINRLGDLVQSFTKTINGPDKREEVSGLVASQISELMYRLGVTLTAVSTLVDLSRQQTEAMSKTLTEIAGS